MGEAFTVQSLADLGVLIFLQAVLGFDNLLYISIESKRAPEAKQRMVRRVGILIAIALRIVLLFVVMQLIDVFAKPFFEVHWTGVLEGVFNFATMVFLLGGVFIFTPRSRRSVGSRRSAGALEPAAPRWWAR